MMRGAIAYIVWEVVCSECDISHTYGKNYLPSTCENCGEPIKVEEKEDEND